MVQGEPFNYKPPKLGIYKIPLQPQALREILDKFAWDLVPRPRQIKISSITEESYRKQWSSIPILKS